jgi:CHAD domain-containing protein
MVSKPNRAFCVLGARGMLQRLHEMMEPITRVRRPRNLDPVHDMRVASRRLRTGFSIFGNCLPSRPLKQWKKRVRKVTRTLGRARDLDVQMDFLRRFFAKTARQADPAGIRRLLHQLQAQRRAAQCRIDCLLDRLERQETPADVRRALARILSLGDRTPLKERSGYNYRQARDRIGARRDKLLALEPYVHRPDCHREHHEMRIAAKHLRYTMEYFQSLYDDGLAEPLKAARKLQTLLGDLHDCSVWIDRVSDLLGPIEHTSRPSAKVGKARPGLLALRTDRQARRKKIYREFRAYWKRLKNEGLWRKLSGTLHAFIPKGERQP